MVDTITLDLQNYEVRDRRNFVVQPAKRNAETGEVIGAEPVLFGDVVGSNAFVNTGKETVDIKPCRDGNVHAFMRFSVPKQVAEDNYQELNYSDFLNALEHAEGKLEEIGIKAKLDEAKIVRLDLFKNIYPDEPVMCYAKVFELLKANYVKDRRTYGVGGWLMTNSQQEYCIYDKLEEMKNEASRDLSSLPETMRFEHRSLRANKVKSFYKFSTIEGLKRFGWEALYEKRRDTWKRNFFKYEVAEVETLAVSQLVMELQYFQAKGGNWFDNYLRFLGATYLCKVGSIEVVKRALEQLGCDRMKIYRAERSLREGRLEVESLKPEEVSTRTLGSLYNELKQKVLA